MHRFFIDENQIEGKRAFIEGMDVKHIRDVLRFKSGDKLELSSKGYVYLAEIEKIKKNKIQLTILSKEEGKSEAEIDIILYQALVKGSKMDLIIQKNT